VPMVRAYRSQTALIVLMMMKARLIMMEGWKSTMCGGNLMIVLFEESMRREKLVCEALSA
jgi:hypothetical protein